MKRRCHSGSDCKQAYLGQRTRNVFINDGHSPAEYVVPPLFAHEGKPPPVFHKEPLVKVPRKAETGGSPRPSAYSPNFNAVKPKTPEPSIHVLPAESWSS